MSSSCGDFVFWDLKGYKSTSDSANCVRNGAEATQRRKCLFFQAEVIFLVHDYNGVISQLRGWFIDIFSKGGTIKRRDPPGFGLKRSRFQNGAPRPSLSLAFVKVRLSEERPIPQLAPFPESRDRVKGAASAYGHFSTVSQELTFQND